MSDFLDNLILQADSYKATHHRQYPPGTETVFSYFEPRIDGVEVVFFGLQYLLERYLVHRRVSSRDFWNAREDLSLHFGTDTTFNADGWRHVINDHNGYLPIRIRAVPEGTVVASHNVLLTIENTCPRCFWLPNYLETQISTLWYPCTVATRSRDQKKVLHRFLTLTGDPSLIDFKLHDFGYRGSTSQESAAIGGAAHLVSFKGTDTLAAVALLRRYYDCAMAGFSIPAAEHSTITSWGEEREVDAYRNMLVQFPTGLVAVVSDSYDVTRACREMWGRQLKAEVEARDGTLVVRPDSGDPLIVLPQVLDSLRLAFGAERNAKGYLVLNPKVRVIQGDGITPESLEAILTRLAQMGWSADNIAFGSGGGLLQKVDRDTFKFAFKCSAIQVNGQWRDVQKRPVTDPSKASKAGRMGLYRTDDGGWRTGPQGDEGDQLETVFENGRLLRWSTLDEVRARAAI